MYTYIHTHQLIHSIGVSVHLSTGYIHLESSSTITLISFMISFRTRSSDAVLVQFGDYGSLELKHGSIVYRRGFSSTNMYTPLTLEALGAVSDGVWHKVRLDVNNTHTKVVCCIIKYVVGGAFGSFIMTLSSMWWPWVEDYSIIMHIVGGAFDSLQRHYVCSGWSFVVFAAVG